MSLATLYPSHLAALDTCLADALQRAAAAGSGFDGVLFHSGREVFRHHDDHPHPFMPDAHYRRWVPPQAGPDHVVWARPGQRPKVVRVRPLDFWFDTSAPEPSYWEAEVDFVEVHEFAAVAGALGPLGRTAYVGPNPEAAAELGLDPAWVEPAALMAPLDWHRAVKTPYEVALLREAAISGARAHAAVRDAFFAGASELELHWEFQRAAGCLEAELAFSTIMACDEKSATLHYQHKRPHFRGAAVFLADAGTQVCGYSSDITRTWVREDVHPSFAALRLGLNALERRLVAMVRPGLSYVEIHRAAHQGIAELLVELDILRMSADEAVATRVVRDFMPHGVGHHLGLFVHDVGGHQAAPEGGRRLPPDELVLRNTRTLEPGHYVTIEPGIYFIPMLLEPRRQSARQAGYNWPLIDALYRCGGVRIEDDVLCTAEGHEDLTRPLIGIE